MTVRTLALAASAVLSMGLLAGCSVTNSGMGGMDHGMGDDSSTSASTVEHNAADEMFVTMMIPHHEQAIEMADMILARDGVDDRVLALAGRIKVAQGPEIETMKAWLDAWGVGHDSMMGGMEGMDHGDGMMSDDDMAALETASGGEASRLFLEQMIEHHQGAIAMAEPEVKNGVNSDVVALASTIISAQTAEIAEMKELLAQL